MKRLVATRDELYLHFKSEMGIYFYLVVTNSLEMINSFSLCLTSVHWYISHTAVKTPNKLYTIFKNIQKTNLEYVCDFRARKKTALVASNNLTNIIVVSLSQ